jgi:hypothetical protein
MEGRKMKVFGVVMALLLVFSFAATFSVSSTVSAGTQKWTKISIPGTDDMQLLPNTDVGCIAVSPDGATLFAAVFAQSTNTDPRFTPGNWYVVKSVDGGYTWKDTGYVGDGSPTEQIVAIDISPAWVDDDVIVVATTAAAYYSEDRGKTFTSMGVTGPMGTITSMDVGIDDDGDATYVLGTNVDVYVLTGFSGWKAQIVDDGYSGFITVLAVSFSPNYGEDGVIFAIITDTTWGTVLRAETDIDNNNWGGYINDAFFVDEPTGLPIGNGAASNTYSACMDFADDFNSAPAVFVGLVAYVGAPGTDPRGDAFLVDLVSGTIGTSAVTDLNVRRGLQTRTNINSIQAAGSATSAYILVGLRDVANFLSMTTWQGQVHYSQNGGESWLQCYKPPSGINFLGQWCAPIVLMEPDFDVDSDTAIAYCSNGYISPAADILFSGFYVSNTKGTSFNGRGLLDHSIDGASGDSIQDIVPSPDYDNDSTLFMVTFDNNYVMGIGDFGLLWETTDGGSHWELILGMTTMIPVPGVTITGVEIPAQYPVEPSIFVTGRFDPIGGNPSNIIVRSTDEGNLFTTTIRGKYDSSHNQLPVVTWKVIDKDTLIISNANQIWKTTDMGAHWYGTDDTEIATGETVVDMQIVDDTTILVGTNQGNVYMCENWETDFSFVQIADGPGGTGDVVHVAFDTNFGENGMIYAGVDGALATCGIWRVDANSADEWEQIWDTEDVYSIACDGNGILWAISDDGIWSCAVREVNPTAPIDDIDFEYVLDSLTSDLWDDLETAPTQTYVFAIGGTFNTELWAYIDTLIKPTLISPADETTAAGTIIQGTSNARVSLMWDDLAKAQWYDYQVAYDTGFGSIAAENTLQGTQVAVNLFLGEKFYWRVRVNGSVWSQWSEVWTFTTPLGPASAKPVCLSPTEGITGVSRTPALQWSSAVEATGFELMVAANCDWSNAIVNLTGSSALGPETAYQITSPQLAEGTNYCWKVRAINSDTDTMSPWSDTGTFTTLVVTVVEKEGTPMWVWVVIALSAVLLVGVVVLIVRTRRPI